MRVLFGEGIASSDNDGPGPGGRITSITERASDCHETWTAVVGQKHAWEERWGERKRESERASDQETLTR
jgi:hypothetical protein